jgi:hypothetical protein
MKNLTSPKDPFTIQFSLTDNRDIGIAFTPLEDISQDDLDYIASLIFGINNGTFYQDILAQLATMMVSDPTLQYKIRTLVKKISKIESKIKSTPVILPSETLK